MNLNKKFNELKWRYETWQAIWRPEKPYSIMVAQTAYNNVRDSKTNTNFERANLQSCRKFYKLQNFSDENKSTNL